MIVKDISDTEWTLLIKLYKVEKNKVINSEKQTSFQLSLCSL